MCNLGVIQWDIKLLTMCFLYGQGSVLHHGLKRAEGNLIQDGVHFLEEPVKRGLVLQISDSTKTAKGATQIPTQVVALLKEFEAIFATLVGLPPNKGHEH